MHCDDVVVGAGSAGAVIAARLSEHPGRHVLLLEAGPDHDAASTPRSISGPNFLAALDEQGRLWDGLTVRRTVGASPTPYLRGRGVGGSSAVNAMIALRGLPGDYDRWERDFACVGWGWRDLARYFERAERTCGVNTVHPSERGPVDAAVRRAASSGGFATSTGEALLGMMAVPLTMHDGQRRSTNDAYLEPVRRRVPSNAAGTLSIRGGATVERVIMNGTRAVGVRLVGGEEIEADRVIVCAGAIHSPALLLHSGIERAGIGENLKEHASAQAMLMLSEHARSSIERPALASVLRWSSATGVLADLQLLPMNMAGTAPESIGLGLVNVALMQVFSAGRVRIDHSHTHTHPLVELALLRDERDLVRLVEGFRTMLSIVRHNAVRAIAPRVVLDEHGTAAESLADADDDTLAAWVMSHAGDYVHAAGTCRMGAVDDELAVVDTRCHVIGYEGLLVVDASVMPDLPRANTNLPVMAIAERAAELLAPD